ncbi:MAG: transcription antitermination factor NusB [Oscillospiraceae bacterium]|jgi:N utilization substance protein B|nr:transcription antitermination factor NusB [Oscillospiraceae bacterium]
MSRIKDRKLAFELLFAETFGEQNIESLFLDKKINEFTFSLFNGVKQNLQEIDVFIKKNIKNWNFDRISRVAKTALRIAVYQMIYEKDIPIAATVNESVEIAKNYGTDDEGNYVQAVLTSIEKNFNMP